MGTYRPCFEIGAGGMATVYIARETGGFGLQRTVALKVMHEHLTRNDKFKKRFLDEARVLNQIAHPYVCRVVGFGEERGRPFMAMEYLVGEPLSRLLRALKKRVDGLCCAERTRLFGRVIADVAEGLHAAHEARDSQGQLLGVVHRDISPQNLFLLYDGTVRILDFGIARYKDRFANTATTGHLLGKLPYMAPEQILGSEYDRRVDVWALGVVFWELVTLDRLFRRETEVRTMEAVCSDPIPNPSSVAEGVPAGLDKILARALERDPERRYQTAREFSMDLEHWLAKTGKPVTHADLSEFLNGFFPGSENERRRWAEHATPQTSNEFHFEQVDYASEGLEAVEEETSLSLPKRVPQDEDDDEGKEEDRTPTRRLVRRTEQLQVTPSTTLPVSAPEPFEPIAPAGASRHSSIPATNAFPVALSVRGTQNYAPSSWARLGAWAVPVLAIAMLTLRGPGTPFVEDSQLTASGDRVAAAQLETAPRAVAVEQDVLPGAPLLAPSPVSAPELPNPDADAKASVEAKASAEANAPMKANAAAEAAPAAATPPSKPQASPPAKGAPVRSSKPVSDTPRSATPPPAPDANLALGTGDVLIVSATPGLPVYLGQRLLGRTPVRTRLAAGSATLSVELSASAPRTTISTQVSPGRLNIVSLK